MDSLQLSIVVSRVAERAYSQLTALVKTSRRQPVSGSRRRDLSDYCRLMSNTFLRLLALLRWLRRQHSMQNMLTVSEFLHRCDVAVCHVANAVADFQVAGLDRVRAPVLDLSSATSVLSTGTFLLPACIKPTAARPLCDQKGAADLDELLRARLTGPDDADALMSLMQTVASDRRACSIVVAAGVVKFFVGGLFEFGVTLRSARGNWILCWGKVLVQRIDLPTHAQKPETEPKLERQLFHFLGKHLSVGACLCEMLRMAHHFCLRLIYGMYVRQAMDLQRGRFAGIIDVDELATSSTGKFLRIRYWGKPTPAHALSMQVMVDGNGLHVQHFPALARPENTNLSEHFCPGRVSFERLLTSTMRARAAARALQLHDALSQPCLGLCDEGDAPGFAYLEAHMSSAVIQLHIQRESGLFALKQVGGGRNEAVLLAWQAQLDQGCGVFDLQSASTMLHEIQRRLLLEKVVLKARAVGGLPTLIDFETSHADSQSAERSFTAKTKFKVYVPVTTALSDGNSRRALKFFMSLSIAEDFTLHADLAALKNCSQGCLRFQSLLRLQGVPSRGTTDDLLDGKACIPSKRRAIDKQSCDLVRANDADISQMVSGLMSEAKRSVAAACDLIDP